MGPRWWTLAPVPEGDPNAGVLITADPAVARAHADRLVGTLLADRYSVHGVIAVGGMGAVLSGEHVHMRKRVAIKVLHPDTSGFPGIVARFEREAIVGAHVEHRNIASARDFGRLDDGSYYLVLEYVKGATLKALVERGPLPPRRAARIARQLAAALAKLHALGIVHRDLNPRNVMVLPGAKDPVKLIDFGFAKVPVEKFDGKSTLEGARRRPAPAPARITADGVIFGTIGYLAPEAALGMRAVDAKSDLYALGCLLYEMLAGRPPFEAATQVDLFALHRFTPPPPIRERAPGVQPPAALETIALRLLEKSPEDRFPDAEEVVRAIDAALAGSAVDELESAPDAAVPLTVAGSEPPPPPARVEDVSGIRGSRPSILREQRRASWATRVAVLVVAGAALFLASRTPFARELLAGVRADRPAPAPASTSAETAADPAPSGAPSAPITTAVPSASLAPPATTPPEDRPTAVDGLDARAWRQVIRRAPHTRDFARAEQAVFALATIDPEGIAGPDMLDAMVDVVVNAGAAPDGGRRLLELLATRFGEGGVDVLYEVIARRGGSTAARIATELVARPEVRARGSAAFRVAMDLRDAPCASKASLADRARAEGDGRALAVLSALRSTDCDATTGACCVFDDPAVETAVRELDQKLRR